jgi:23S rRNA (adenine2503-C2)-methyltransferase
MKTEKTNIRTLSKSEILEYFEDLGEPKFRAAQVYEWIWQKQAFKFEDMTNLSKELRTKLARDFAFPALQIDTTQYEIQNF